MPDLYREPRLKLNPNLYVNVKAESGRNPNPEPDPYLRSSIIMYAPKALLARVGASSDMLDMETHPTSLRLSVYTWLLRLKGRGTRLLGVRGTLAEPGLVPSVWM